MKNAKFYPLTSEIAQATLKALDNLKEGDEIKSDLLPAFADQIVWKLKSRVDKYPLESWLLQSEFCSIPFYILWVKITEKELSFAFEEAD